MEQSRRGIRLKGEGESMIRIILPAYNEAQSINILLSKIKATMEKNSYEYEVLIVNDGSEDNTAEKVQTQDMPIEIIEHKRNRGLWETVRNGFEAAADRSSPDDIIIRMDADDTHEPKYIPRMVSKIAEGYDVVIASRFQRGGGAKGLNAYRTLISRCANCVMKIIFPIKGIWEYSCGFRAYRAGLVQDALRIFGNEFIDLKGVGFTCTIEKLIKFRMMGAKFTEVPFVLRYNQKMSTSKMLSSITTLGYFVLILKYICFWGQTGREWKQKIKALKQRDSKRGV